MPFVNGFIDAHKTEDDVYMPVSMQLVIELTIHLVLRVKVICLCRAWLLNGT